VGSPASRGCSAPTRSPSPSGAAVGGPGEQVVLVPAHTVALGAAARPDPAAGAPWPGHLPAPSPALVHEHPGATGRAVEVAEVVAADGRRSA
jgi:hypothetical protein